jgi:hypothetical protein
LNTVRFELLVERPLSKELRAVVATGKRSKPALQLQNPVVTLDGENQGEIRSRRALLCSHLLLLKPELRQNFS